MTEPSFLIKSEQETPTIHWRLYRGRKLMVWYGKAKLSSIQGWTDNPRIELIKREWKQKMGLREPTQDELFDMMKTSEEFKLTSLRDDILKNGLREPLTLSYSGRLLDGNRRYFAVRYALETMGESNPNRADFEKVEVYVLTDNATETDEEHVLVEENFSPSLKLEWPDYVKARHVLDEFEEGKTSAQIAEKFNWPKAKVQETKRIGEIIQSFEAFATSEKDPSDEYGGGLGLSESQAEALAAKNYQFFNEAQKSFFKEISSDLDFQVQFFKWIKEEKFNSFPEVRVAYKAWKDPEAKTLLLSNEPNAAKKAKAALDYNEKVVGTASEAEGRIGSFVKFLKQLKADEISKLAPNTVVQLEEALTLLAKMTKAATGLKEK